jgi:hypothetical protein
MPNNRVFYASQGVKVGASTVQGAQSVGVTSNFNLEQAFQLGQLSLYDNIVVDPEVEVTVSKVLDSEDTIWKLATGGGTLVSNANDETTVILGVGDDTAASLSGAACITFSGMFISSLTYTFPVDGNFTEEVTFVGNNKQVGTGSVSAPSDTDTKVMRRQNLDVGNSSLPTEVSGKNITSITISADLGRESMYKLGQYAPFHRFVNFPLEVTTEIEVSATSHDGVAMDLPSVGCTGGSLPTGQQITVVVCDTLSTGTAYTFNMGNKNTLQSVNYTGGDTGGGNATITYSYTTYNDLDITG